MSNYILGIHLGISTVKVSILDVDTQKIVEQYTKDTNCDVQSNVAGAHEQHVPTIISTLNICVSKINQSVRKNVSKIGICGQMHGVLLWKTEKGTPPWSFYGKTYRIDESKISRLITSKDARCSTGFLASLPKPDSHIGISAGFGIPTLFWLKDRTPEDLIKFNHSGSISSFVVAMLCNLDKEYMSYQNAASWGYFNCHESQWNLKLLEKHDFPIDILPKLKASGEIAGNLKNAWQDIPEGIPVGADLGDLQCSLLSTLRTEEDAYISFSDTSKMAFIVNNFTPPNGPPVVNPLVYWPYFDNQYIAVAQSLNGGNVLGLFVEMLSNWLNEVGQNVDQDEIWKRLIALGMKDNMQSKLEIKPTCMGERSAPDLLASVFHVTGTNVALGHVFRVICKGLIENLHTMLPAQLLKEAKIRKIVGNGIEFFNNDVLRREVEQIYQLPLIFDHISDPSRGVALALLGRYSISSLKYDQRCMGSCTANYSETILKYLLYMQ